MDKVKLEGYLWQTWVPQILCSLSEIGETLLREKPVTRGVILSNSLGVRGGVLFLGKTDSFFTHGKRRNDLTSI